MTRAIILFDGICNLCSWSVQFIIDRDPSAYFQFASIQSLAGQQILAAHGHSVGEITSVVLIEDGALYLQSDAAMGIAQRLCGWWRLAVLLEVIPRPLRDKAYQHIARNRYRWFGTRAECRFPTAALQDRFLTRGTR